MRHTFKGGVHPPDHKAGTRQLSMEQIPAPREVYLSLRQHLGAQAKPLVKKGDYVLLGQKIAESAAAISANLHSSVSGTVLDIIPYFHPSGNQVDTIVIQNDGHDTPDPSISQKGTLESLTPRQIIDMIRDAGIVGMGGAGFPTHVKLSIPEGKQIEEVIVNAAECEPYLTSDHRAMLESPEDVIDGLRLAMKACGAKRGVIAIEKNKQDAIAMLKEKAENYPELSVYPLKTKYPQGAEKQLIRVITGRQVPSGGLPADVHVVVMNVDTVSAVARAASTGMPLISRIVTVSGGAVKTPRNLKVRIGTRICDLFDYCGGLKEQVHKIVSGGPMMGLAQYSDEVPIIKTSSAVLALSEDEAKIKPESPCIKCGKCVRVCPMGLMPVYMNLYTLTNQLSEVEKLGVFDCIECGSCSYICPANRYLVQSFKIAKQNILEEKRKAASGGSHPQ